MDLIATFLIVSCAVFLCECSAIKNQEACAIIRRTLKSCYADSKSLTFMQSSQSQGDTVTFFRNDPETLRIQCHAATEIQLNKIPNINFSEVKTIVLEQCSLSNSLTLKKIKESFKLTGVESLKIKSTRSRTLVELSSDFFQNFIELETLELEGNDYITFTENVFESLRNLNTLKLLVHDIIVLPHNVFKPLWKLETLWIVSSGRMKEETKTLNFTLNWCINLKHFHLSEVRWPIKVNNLLSFNRPLESVSIVNNRIEVLSEKVFNGSSEILEISLVNNNLQSLPKKVFSTQVDLEKINLSQNQLESLDDELFSNNTELEVINLSHNKLKSTSRKLFAKLEHLVELDLSHNQMTQINFGSNLGNMSSLKVLTLSHNSISKLVADLQCPSLTHLDLTVNRLTRVFVDQFYAKSLKNLTINLQQNSLESVDFRNLNSSESNAKLFINIDEVITCNCHTISLYNFFHRRLAMNQSIYDGIEVSPVEVRCDRTELDTPATVRDIKKDSLTCPLNLPHQRFCPNFCKCLRRPSDGVLIISCANVSFVPMLPNYRRLTDIKLDKIELKIQGNEIDQLPSKLRDPNYNDVTAIHASHNVIQVLFVENFPDHLEYLDLKFNRLTHVSLEVVTKIATLSFVHLSKNPWNCSASTDLIRFVKTHRLIAKDFNVILCSNQKYFLEIDVEEKCNGQVYAAILIILGLVTSAAIFYTYRHYKETIVEWIFLNDKHHVIERVLDKMKLFDATVIAADNDKVFGKYIAAKLMEKPNEFKIGLFLKDWSANEAMSENVLKCVRKSRRAVVVISEYFDETQWKRWNHFNTNTRIIFIEKGKSNGVDIKLSNAISIKLSDPWFWDKLQHAMVSHSELNVDEQIEMEPLNYITSD